MSQSESPRNLTCYLWNKGQPVHEASDVSCFQWWVAEGTADLGSPSPRIYCHVSPAYCRWNSTDRFHVCSKQAGSKSLTFLCPHVTNSLCSSFKVRLQWRRQMRKKAGHYCPRSPPKSAQLYKSWTDRLLERQRASANPLLRLLANSSSDFTLNSETSIALLEHQLQNDAYRIKK